MSFHDQVTRTLEALAVTPGWRRLQQFRPDCGDETTAEILAQAASFAERVLAPLNAAGDREGAQLVHGRVTTPAGFADAFHAYAQAGWLAMDIADDGGGQGLPLTLQAACGPLFERGCVALMMAAGSTRAAAHLISEAGDEQLAREWVPKLASGERTATICISEADAGSDVGRLRTRAERVGDEWRISGRKTWISFGDHDMTQQIGHCLLARSGDAPGTKGLSLFLVPNIIDGGPNGVTVERLEDKMGLHASPTCTLNFDQSRGTLIGSEGRGLNELFGMIELMRLQTACQGLGLASASVDIAEQYARERRQGGDAENPPVVIAEHPDVQRQLRGMRNRTEVLRLAVLELATVMDLARCEPDSEKRRELADFSAWMLPLIKNFGADTGFVVANAAIQVLGGAGYTRDWPLEQYLRDARVMTIYEGTTGIQALDFLTRRLWRDNGAGLKELKTRMGAELSAADVQVREARAAHEKLDAFEAFSQRMMPLQSEPEKAYFHAHDYFLAGWETVFAWMELRLCRGRDIRQR